ncbi:MAG: hydrogenase maturation protease [Desulfobacteraceae bacterium]|nr:hydrogenase maturation protease [Desulfobacteraceae bacterium]
MILILAYGNSLRRDDGAGFVLADLIERLLADAGAEVERIDSHQLTPELSLDIAGQDVASVLFIDTRAVPGPSDDLRVHVERISAPGTGASGVGHNLDASIVLAYARGLFGKEPPAWLITVPGFDFEHGEGLSERTLERIDGARESLRDFAESIARSGACGLANGPPQTQK